MKEKSPTEGCCGLEPDGAHPDHSNLIRRLNRISGQVEGVKRMIAEREYCPRIIVQIQAARAALKSLESLVLEKHLAACVQEALQSRDRREADGKMAELIDLFRRS